MTTGFHSSKVPTFQGSAAEHGNRQPARLRSLSFQRASAQPATGSKGNLWSRVALIAILAVGSSPGAAQVPLGSTLIRGAHVVDGTGTPAQRVDVRISSDRIVAVGQLSPVPSETLIDAGGLTLAPGFIDTHSHHDRGLEKARDALAMVSQGVTTIVVGQDGGGSRLYSNR